MFPSTHIKALFATALVLLIVAVPASAAGKTETLRMFSKVQSFTYTTADGTVTHAPPNGPPQAGDVMEIDSIDFKGNHEKHAKRPSGSDYLHCTFGADRENPDCFGYAAVKGNLLRFHGLDFIGGTGKYHGATGRVAMSQEVPGGSDIVLKLKLK